MNIFGIIIISVYLIIKLFLIWIEIANVSVSAVIVVGLFL